MKKFQPEEMRGEGGRGYERMGEVCRDLGEVVDVLWRSGTREFLFSFYFSFPFLWTLVSGIPQGGSLRVGVEC